VLVERVDEATMRAVGYARALRPLSVSALHVGRGEEARVVSEAWAERRLPVTLDVVEGDADDLLDHTRRYIRNMERPEDEFVTIVVPEVLSRSKLRHYFRRRQIMLLKAGLLFERGVVVTDIPVREDELAANSRGAVAPTRVIAIVLVSAVHNATLRALEYARSLAPTQLHAVTFSVDPEETARCLSEWTHYQTDVPLEAVDSPYREVAKPLVRYAREVRARTPDAVVSVILPEFVVRKWWHQFLHNQTALLIKSAVLFEPGIVVTSVPYHLT
jgi:hypothetical protein